MEGYRLTLNLSYQLSTSLDGSNSTHMSCDTEDDLETSAILVRGRPINQVMCVSLAFPFLIGTDTLAIGSG